MRRESDAVPQAVRGVQRPAHDAGRRVEPLFSLPRAARSAREAIVLTEALIASAVLWGAIIAAAVVYARRHK